MSRVGKYPVKIPRGVTVAIADGVVSAKGANGELSFASSPDLVEVTLGDGEIIVAPRNASRRAREMWGTTRARLNNLVVGVSQGFRKTLEIVGVGYRGAVQGSDLVLSLGFSHDVVFPIPRGVSIKTPQATRIEISGADKQVVGQVAADVRAHRPPEPFKGKGVRYADERIRRKEGKKK